MNVHRLPGSGIIRTERGLRLMNMHADERYTNAQIDDYANLPRCAFRWRPPLRLRLRARFSNEPDALRGTAGFGFWNDRFLMTGWRMPAPPSVAWFFFASPPSDMPLAVTVPGQGWKASTIDATRPRAWRWAALAPALPILLRRSQWRRQLWPALQRDLGVAETPLRITMTHWHEYMIDWGQETTLFAVDGQTVLRAPSPRGPLGLVIWIDNQWMVATPTGRFGHGVLALDHAQWLEVADAAIE